MFSVLCSLFFIIADRATWYRSLPTKRMAAAAILWNERGEILIVKPTYRPAWLMPGGAIEVNESPRAACKREVQEELGLTLKIGRLLNVDYQSPYDDKNESVQFLFAGGILNQSQIDAISLPADELSECRWCMPEIAYTLLFNRLAERVKHAIYAEHHHTTMYSEDGVAMWDR